MKQTISVLVENKPGVLSKVVGLFSRRGYNIESLAVGETADKTVSLITIVVEKDEYIIEQIVKQLNKLIDVIKVREYNEGEYIGCGVTLIKVRANEKNRMEILKAAELFGAKLLDAGQDSLTFAVTDTTERTKVFESLVTGYGIKEIARTGTIAISK